MKSAITCRTCSASCRAQRRLQQAAGSKAQANNIQVRVELQADCLGGVWANHAQRKKDFIDPGDIEGAIAIASAIGDDRLQKQSHGRVVPDSFTHGSAEQRVRWFKTGFKSGKVSACDTFQTSQSLSSSVPDAAPRPG